MFKSLFQKKTTIFQKKTTIDQELRLAAKEGNNEKIQQIISKDPNIDLNKLGNIRSKNLFEKNALHYIMLLKVEMLIQ